MNDLMSADDGYVVSFARAGDGMLAPQPSPYGCLATITRAGCGLLDAGSPMRHIVVSPDSRHVYTVGTPPGGLATRLLSFRIDNAPRCAPVAASTAFNTATTIKLACSDADGDALAYEALSQPQRGFLGSIQADGSVPFAPLAGLTGPDSFTYRASAAGIASDPATATVDVQAQPGGGGTPPAPAVERIASTVRPFWVEYRRYVVLRRLRISGIPAGAAVQVRCKGKRCPFKRKYLPRAQRPRQRLEGGTERQAAPAGHDPGADHQAGRDRQGRHLQGPEEGPAEGQGALPPARGDEDPDSLLNTDVSFDRSPVGPPVCRACKDAPSPRPWRP